MTASEVIKLQAKLLEWQAPKGHAASLMCYKCFDDVWITDGIVIAKISAGLNKLSVPERTAINGYITIPDNATKAWLTPTQWKDKELGVCIRAETATEGVWVRDKYLKLFGKGDYDLYITPEAKQLWLTEPNTREVLGVIAGVKIGGAVKVEH